MAPSRKNESKSLKLNSPVGAEPAYFKWPLESQGGTGADGSNSGGLGGGGNEIVEIMKSVCEDYPELALPIKNHIIKDFDASNYDSVKSCCDKFNRAIAQINLLFSGTYRPGKQRANPSRKLLKHIIQLSYNRAVDDVEKLNEYEPFSPQVYGETSFDLICKMLDDVPVKETDTFIDLGSGVGQVVLQVAALTNCKMCYGIEKSDICVEYANKLETEFRFWMNWYGKVYTDFELIKGDFLDDNYACIMTNCSFIFVNNFAFGPAVDHQLKLRFQHLHDGTRIVASKAFAPIKFRASGRNMSDIASIMRVSELASLKGSVSWTENPVSYYLHIIDTTLLESFFEQQKLKSSSRSGSDDTASERTDSCESNVGGRSDVESPPVQSETASAQEATQASTVTASSSKSAAKDTTTSSKGAGSSKKQAGTTSAGKVVRKYPRRSSRKNLLGPAATAAASDSSSSTSSGFDKKPLAHYSSERKKTAAADSSSPVATSTPSTNTASPRGRATRRKPAKKTSQAQSSTPERGGSGKGRGGSPAAKHRKTSGPRGATESGLEMLHSHSVASTSNSPSASLASRGGQASTSPIHSSKDKKSVSVSASAVDTAGGGATYKELNVKVEDLEAMSAAAGAPTTGSNSGGTVAAASTGAAPATSSSSRNKGTPVSGSGNQETVSENMEEASDYIPGLDELMAVMKSRYVQFIEQMQSAEYAEMLQHKINEERLRGHLLRNKVHEVRTEIRQLEKHFVHIFNSRLNELGIEAETPCEFVDKAKSIITIHEALRVRTREEQELYNKEYELLQRNIEARRQEYQELSLRLHREQGTVLPPFDVNMIVSVKQAAAAASAAQPPSREEQLAGVGGGTNRVLQLTPVEMLKRGDIVDLETLIATQLQSNSVAESPVAQSQQQQQQLYRVASNQQQMASSDNRVGGSNNPATGGTSTGAGAGATVLIVCKGCGTPSTHKHMAQSSNGLCMDCDSRGTGRMTSCSPRGHQSQLSRHSLVTDGTGRSSLSDLTADPRAAASGAGGRGGAVNMGTFSIDNLVSPSRLHQTATDSILISGTSQHSSVVSSGSAAGSGTGGGSSAGGYCLPLSATLSSPILRAGLTNPQQKQLLHTIPHTPSNSTHTHISAHAIQQDPELSLQGKLEDKSAAGLLHDNPSMSSSRMRSQGSPAVAARRDPLTFPKFEEYNRKRGTWDPATSHGKPCGYTGLESINNLVEKVAATTYKLPADQQEDLCYKCILIGYLPVELRPEWEDPKAAHASDYSTPSKPSSAAASATSNLSMAMAAHSNQSASSSVHSQHGTVAHPSTVAHLGSGSSSSSSSSAAGLSQLPISYDHSSSAGHKYSATAGSTSGVGALNLLASVSTKAMAASANLSSNLHSHSPHSQAHGKHSSTGASTGAGGSHVTTAVTQSAGGGSTSSSSSAAAQWESAKMRTESQDRINSVISQVLKSSTHTMPLFIPSEVQAEITVAKMTPAAPAETEAPLDEKPVRRDVTNVEEHRPKRPVVTAAAEEPMDQSRNSSRTPVSTADQETSIRPLPQTDQKSEECGGDMEVDVRDSSSGATDQTPSAEEGGAGVEGEGGGDGVIEDDEEEDQCSQTSSLNASTIAACDREPGGGGSESANVSMCSGTDHESQADTSQAEDETTEIEDAMETELDVPSNSREEMEPIASSSATGDSAKKNEKATARSETTRKLLEAEDDESDETAAKRAKNDEDAATDDSLLKTTPATKALGTTTTSNEKLPGAGSGAAASTGGSSSAVAVAVVDDVPVKRAVTKKDVAKHFQAISAAAEEAAAARNASSSFSTSSTSVNTSVSNVELGVSLETKGGGLEVVTAELPTQLLTEPEAKEGLRKETKETPPPPPKQNSNNQLNSSSSSDKLVEKKDDGAKAEEGTKVKKADHQSGNDCSTAASDELAQSNKPVADLPKQEQPQNDVTKSEQSQSATNFDFSQVNFDNTDFVDDDDKKLL